ncbi:MAG: 6-phosphofructokinase, partial [Anaerolineae bacterium]
MPAPVRRIGVLTGGGDCPGLNAVIRAVVKTAINDYGWEVIGIEDGFEGLILPDKARPLNITDVRGLLPRGGTILGTTNRANPFSYSVRTPAGGWERRDVSDQVMARLVELRLDALVVIGGDGSLHIAQRFLELGAAVVGVPKTIDNDIAGTDVTFGFDTAVNTATEAIDRLHTTAESHHRVMVLEVMGREAGWIALQAGLAGGADVILIPEIPFRLEPVAAHIQWREARGARFSIVVTAEGAYPAGGERVYQAGPDPFVGRRLGGIGEVVGRELARRLDMEVRTTVLGHLQRGGSPSAFDRVLASRFGASVVHLIAQGQIGRMVALRGETVTHIPIAEAVRQ